MSKEKVSEDEELKWIYEKVASEIEPFLDGIRTKQANYELFKKAYLDFAQRIERGAKIILWLDEECKKLKSVLFGAFFYLGIVESLGNTIIDLVVLLLIANGRDFHIECQHRTPRIKHAMTFKDLERERVSLTTKLNFLEDNDLKTLTSLVDTQFRNTIAHLKFDIKDDKIFIKGKQLTNTQLNNILRKTVEVLMAVDMSIREVMKEKGIDLF